MTFVANTNLLLWVYSTYLQVICPELDKLNVSAILSLYIKVTICSKYTLIVTSITLKHFDDCWKVVNMFCTQQDNVHLSFYSLRMKSLHGHIVHSIMPTSPLIRKFVSDNCRDIALSSALGKQINLCKMVDLDSILSSSDHQTWTRHGDDCVILTIKE